MDAALALLPCPCSSDTSIFGLGNSNPNHHPSNIRMAVGRIEAETEPAVTGEDGN